MVFELVLDGNELWLHVIFENQAIEEFFIQAFHEGTDLEGSQQYQFMKEIFKNPDD